MNCNIWAIVIILLIIIIIGLIVFSQKHSHAQSADILENFNNTTQPYDPVKSSNIIALNNSIITNKNFNMGYNNFYIDKEVSEVTGIQEDETRNFRHPMQNNKKQWNGYNVFKQPKFGDSMLLDEQLSNDISSDKRDLYQYSLWMTIIGLTNYQKKYKNKTHID